MLADRIFLFWPVWLIVIITLVLLLGMMVLGAAARRRHDRRAEEGEEARTHEGYIVSGALGLLALLLGFTFALAVDRFDARRGLVLEEANAIGTTYLRAQLLDEPHRSRLSRLLTGYAQNRLDLANAEDYERRAALMAQTNEYQTRLWAETVAAIRPIRGQVIAGTFVETMNATIDAGAARVAARRAHVPGRVMIALLLYMAVAAFLFGFAMPPRRRPTTTAVLLTLLTLAYGLILDIDRPTGGSIREPQSAMEDLVEMMRTSPPAAFGP